MIRWEYAAGHDPHTERRLILRRYLGQPTPTTGWSWHVFATLHTSDPDECRTAVNALNGAQP